jgi:hypothetical protein
MLHLALVFVHFLAAALALGAIVATDLRLLSKLAQDRVRIAPPNAFVSRIVVVSLVVLCATGAAIVAQAALVRVDELALELGAALDRLTRPDANPPAEEAPEVIGLRQRARRAG